MKKADWNNKYFWGGMICVLIVGVITVASVCCYGIDESEFVLGVLASAIGAMISHFFSLNENRIAECEKKKDEINNVLFELTVNYTLLNEWYERTKDWSFIYLNKAGFNADLLLKIEKLRNITIEDLNDENTKKVINYIKMIEKIKSGSQLTPDYLYKKVEEAKEMIDIVKALR